MKNRIKAILLATGLTVSMLTTAAYAEEAATEAVTEAAEVESEAVTEADSEAAPTGETETADASAGVYAAYYDSMKEAVPQTLQALASMTDEQLEQIIENSEDASMTAITATWQSVKNDLGNFVEVTDQEVTEEGTAVTVTSIASYDGVDGNAPVIVTYTYDLKANTQSLDWNVDYPMSTLMKQAGLNTVMGLGIVFIVLLFLSYLIGQIHWIPDLIEGRQKKSEEAKPVPAPAPAAPVEEEEDYVDDLELVAVITAAIAASENTSSDGFVVRSIKKANRRKWQNA